jgi:Fungal specific transcription factor domain
MRHLTRQKEVAIHSKQRVEIFLYRGIVERLIRRVIALLQSEALKSPKHNVSIFVLFRYAALLHMYMFMRDTPREYPFCNLLTTRLRACIEAASDLSCLQQEYPEMLLWALIMGGLGISNTADRRWYAKLLAKACITLGLRGGNAIGYMLMEFLWSELCRSPVTIGFWNDVTRAARAQGMDSEYEVRKSTGHISVASFNIRPVIVD